MKYCAMMAIWELISTFWPPKDNRDRRWWRLGIVMGGSFFVIGGILIVIWKLQGGN